MPTRDKDERPVNGQPQAGEVAVDKAVSEHRRKIIKASAAIVPAIMTIRSGAAAAVTSLNQCEARDTAATALLPESMNVVAEPDEWVRMETWQIKMVVDDPNNPPIILYGIPDNGVVPGTIEQYPAWYDEYGNTRSNKSPYKEYVDVVKKKEFEGGEAVFSMCYVNAAAGTFSVYPQQAVATLDLAASPITASCLCSVNPDFTLR